MHKKKHPDHKDDLFTHHLPSIDIWLQTELSVFCALTHPKLKMTGHILTSVTLVDFPQFPDIYHLIPRFLDLSPQYRTEHNYPQIEDSGKWGIYVKYCHITINLLPSF